jgi:hypothetical protein
MQFARRFVFHSGYSVFFIAMTVVAADAARAAVVGTGVRVTATVQELMDGSPGSVNRDEKELETVGDEPGLEAAADLTSTDLGGTLVSWGRGIAQFTNPGPVVRDNPRELGLEVACYSNAESVSYLVDGQAKESREILFASRGGSAAPEIRFRRDGTREVESTVYLNGAVLLWSTSPNSELGNLQCELGVTIGRDESATPLFETTLSLTAGGGAGVAIDSTGPIRFEEVGLEELAELGVDEATLALLAPIAESGTLLVVALPPQEHSYRYEVTADEELVLTATLEARVRNAPQGTGVSAVLGRPFSNLAKFVEQGLPGVNGLTLERSINAATARRSMGLLKDDSAPPPRGTLCGAMGTESLALTAFLFLGLLGRPGRIRP